MRSALDNICIVLDEPQDVVNIAAVVRAMKNLGLSRLRLVRPAEFDVLRITGIAHRSEDIVGAALHFETLADALADAVHVAGTTTRARTAKRNYGRPRHMAPALLDRARDGTVAILFGREDRGLTNAALDRCQTVLIIPTVPEYASLNLAHAVLIVAYELFLAAGGEERPLPLGKRRTEPAQHRDLEEMYRALESALLAIEFFKAREPDRVMRSLRTLLSRAEPELREAHLVSAIGLEVMHFLARARGGTERGDAAGRGTVTGGEGADGVGRAEGAQ
ncbi:MAG: RNA methyltransferase [Gemmatimonadetes bacterium]|nr:RNA methyltransferase [Gemmatimonadota bacterium]